jgi:hypothetical protein
MKETLKVRRHPLGKLFGTLKQIVGLRMNGLGLQRPCVPTPSLSSMIQGILPSSRAMCPHHHQNPNPCMMSSPPSVTFWPQKEKRWASRGMGEVLQGISQASKGCHHHPVCGPWYPTCGLQAPRKPKLGLFFQICPPTRSCKDNEYALQGSQVKCIMMSKSNQ